MRTASWAISLLLLLCGAAAAQEPIIGGHVFVTKSSSAYTGPGDLVSGAKAWWGLRAYNAAKASALFNVGIFRRSSDSTNCTGLLAAVGNLDITTTYCSGSTSLPTFCGNAGGSCFASTMFDQSGNSNDVTQATAANQPALVFNCIGSLPCLQVTTSSQTMLTSGSITPATGTLSFSLVINHAVGTSAATMLRENGASSNRISGGNGVLVMNGGTSGSISATMSGAAFHAVQAMMNGTASSVVNIDGTETTGTVTGSTTAGTALFFSNVASQTYDMTEGGIWDNIAFSSTQRANLCHNQFTYWGAGCP